MRLDRKRNLLQKRRWRIRRKVSGTADKPRLVVTFTNLHIYAQCVDDVSGRTLAHAASLNKDLQEEKLKANVEGAARLGKIIAERAKGVGVTTVVFDRAGRRYHGCVKAFADSAREGGLEF